MEMMIAPTHRSFTVQDPSQVGEVRRAAVGLAQELGFDQTACGRVALVATELGTNLARHARNGQLLLAAVSSGAASAMVELLSLDQGPGIANFAKCLADGYSTLGTSGTGLGAVRRLSAEFDAFSHVSSGTVLLARIAASREVGSTPVAIATASAFCVGAVAVCAPGESVCGDTWELVQDGANAAVIMADGLGHGPLAAEAARAATTVFRRHAGGLPSQVLGQVHLGLKSTRGAAVAMARLDRQEGSMVFCGAGNITSRLISGVEDRTLISQNGTAGLQIRALQDVRYDWPAHALLIMHSDGITTRWHLGDVPGLLQHHPSVVAAWILRDHLRGRDDATVVVVRRQSPS
jgi:anti-sigma regulatory factor (Ser/Thr protein kinase)